MTLRILAALGAVVGLVAVAPATSAAEPAPKTPIRHFITLMHANHSFDNYFGTYPGADGIPPGVCMPVEISAPRGRCIKPTHIGNRAPEDLNDSERVFRGQFNRGRMNGFIDAMTEASGRVRDLVMAYYDDREIPYYWNVADQYVLFDRFFTSAHNGSVTNRMFWVTGGPGNPDGDFIPQGGYDRQTTIFDRLQEKGISWKFYVQNYDPRITFRAEALGDRGSQVVWVPLVNYGRYIDDPELFKNIVPMDQFYEDVRRGQLPAVSYIVPSGSNEHPPSSIKAGETFVRTIIGALMGSPLWRSTAVQWTYDDWGGWYDHVRPPQVDRHGYGFRVPAMLVSPWAKAGHVEHSTMDFTSILKFIEQNWGLEPLTARDRRANSLMRAFDFSRRPRPAVLLNRTRGARPLAEPRRAAIYVGYGAATLLTLLVIAGAVTLDRRSRQRRPRPHGPSTRVLVDAGLTERRSD